MLIKCKLINLLRRKNLIIMKKFISLTTLCLASFLLTACQHQSENTSSASSEAIASSTSSTSSTSEENKSVTSLINEESSLPSEKKGMDISAIQNGDFSSVAGTWRNSTGIEFTFDKNGLVSDNSKISIEHAKETDHYLKANYLSKDGGAGSAIAFLPAGISLTMSVTSSPDNGYTDTSDTTQDRLWSGQQLINGHTDGFFYKVK